MGFDHVDKISNCLLFRAGNLFEVSLDGLKTIKTKLHVRDAPSNNISFEK